MGRQVTEEPQQGIVELRYAVSLFSAGDTWRTVVCCVFHVVTQSVL
jgi:hypothetical protein